MAGQATSAEFKSSVVATELDRVEAATGDAGGNCSSSVADTPSSSSLKNRADGNTVYETRGRSGTNFRKRMLNAGESLFLADNGQSFKHAKAHLLAGRR